MQKDVCITVDDGPRSERGWVMIFVAAALSDDDRLVDVGRKRKI